MKALNQLFEEIEKLQFLIPKAIWEKYLALKQEIQLEIELIDDDIVYYRQRVTELERENCDLADEASYLVQQIEEIQQDYNDYMLLH